MKRWKQIREPEYKQIKQLCDLKIKISKIALLTGRSWGTIWMIQKSKNWEEFRPVKTETTPKEAVSKKVFSTNTDKIIPYLERITTALERMEQHWQPTAEKKSFKIF